jgi:hypothetical protein
MSEKLMLKHGHFEQFTSESMMKIRNNFKDDVFRMVIYRHIKNITKDASFLAYMERKDELIKEFNLAQEQLPKDQRKPPMLANIPGLSELLKMDSGLEIEKLEISNKLLNKDISEIDMTTTDWLFEFVD